MFFFNLKYWLVPGIATLCFSCTSVYKIKSPNTEIDKLYILDSLNKLNKFFILRSGPKAFSMQNVGVDHESGIVTANLGPLPSDHLVHVINSQPQKKRFLQYYKHVKDSYNLRDSGSISVLKETHVYVNPDSSFKFGNHQLKKSDIAKIEVPLHDVNKTRNRRAGVVIGTTLVIGGIVGFVAIMSQLSSWGN